jgi:hypothetical protein
MRAFILGLACAAFVAAGAALAQAPAPPAGAPARAAPAGEAAAPKAKAKAKAARPASAVTVTNATAQTLAEVVITGEDQTAKLSKPLRPKAKAVLKLPKHKGCVVTVAATFEGGGTTDAGEHDVCKDKTIRFTE